LYKAQSCLHMPDGARHPADMVASCNLLVEYPITLSGTHAAHASNAVVEGSKRLPQLVGVSDHRDDNVHANRLSSIHTRVRWS